jgi:hypothetical protein
VWDPETLHYAPGKNSGPDVFMQRRLNAMKKNALRFRPLLHSTLKYAPNAQAAGKCRKVMALYNSAFGPMTFLERAKSLGVRLLAMRENRRIREEGMVMRQPPTSRTTYADRSLKPAREGCPVAIAAIGKPPEMEASV